MASTKLLSVPANQISFSGCSGYPSSSNGRVLVIQPSTAGVIKSKFALPRMTVSNKGIHLQRVGLTYKFTQGTLATVVNTLTKQSHSDAATGTDTSITLSTASPTFDLTSPAAGQSSRGMQAVAGASLAAANPDEANTSSSTFLYQSTMTADSSGVVLVEIISVEVEYSEDESEPSVSSLKTANYTLVLADSGQEILVDLETTGNVQIALPALAAANEGAVFTVKCSVSHSGGTRIMSVLPAASDKIQGLGLNASDNEAFQIVAPKAGDYIKLQQGNTTAAVGWFVIEARGAWAEATP